VTLFGENPILAKTDIILNDVISSSNFALKLFFDIDRENITFINKKVISTNWQMNMPGWHSSMKSKLNYFLFSGPTILATTVTTALQQVRWFKLNGAGTI